MIHLFVFILGCCIGSFVNVIFSRKDWHKGRSRCDNCGYILKWYDMIPLVSYLLLRGNCRKCKKKIDAAHFMSELIMGTAFLVSSLSFTKYGIYYGIIISVALFFLALAAIEDYKEQMVYSVILNGGIVLTLIAKCVLLKAAGGNTTVFLTAISVLILKMMAYIASFAFKDKIGAGDFDVFIILYILGEWQCLLMSVTLGCIIGCIIYIPQIILKKRDRKEPLPLIPLLFAGTVCFLLM